MFVLEADLADLMRRIDLHRPTIRRRGSTGLRLPGNHATVNKSVLPPPDGIPYGAAGNRPDHCIPRALSGVILR